ncbi:insulinase family protein [Aliikangiella coralliicola]|uniref:Insulinase family protein n=2 Tax=Aliikangiella coralliicola TaxID=2592383 RepID=A0A545UK99_9GAMM|nr:insulinase family protein [Aliikangiella coralliicola]
MVFMSMAEVNAATRKSDVKSFTLSNGMTILVVEDQSIPNANMYLFWKVGSRNEVPGITGLSHFFEHMMFNGAKKYGPKQFDKVMEANGGANNAYTTENLTVYTNWFPSDSIEVMFDLEADRIQHLAIDEKMVESERGVVTSERSTGLENSNVRMIMEEVKGAAFRAHPYSWSVIGHQSDIDSWTLQDLKDFHRTYYAPNNAFVVIAGDVKLSQVKKLAKKYWEPIPAQPAPQKVRTVEPEQRGERRVYVQKSSVTSPNIMLAYHVPATSSDDYYPLEMLSNILGNGDSSRLIRSLIDEQQLATSIFTYFPKSFDPNLFYVYAVAAKDVSAEKLEKAVVKEINKVIKEGVTQGELEKEKNKAQVNFYRTISTINGKANTLGTYALYFGDYSKLFSAVEDMQNVTVEDIKRVASTYLRKKNRTVGILAAEEDSQEEDL